MSVDKKAIGAEFAKKLLESGDITEEEYLLLTGKRQNKMNAVRTELDGITFHSGKEANRWAELQILLAAGEIADLKRQVPYSLDVNNVHICNYVADFVYYEHLATEPTVEDAKGYRTPEYQLKKKLMLAVYAIKIKET